MLNRTFGDEVYDPFIYGSVILGNVWLFGAMGKNHSPSFPSNPSKELYLKVIHMSGTTLGWRSSNHVFPHATPSVAVTGDTRTQTHMQSINSNCINMINMHVNRYTAIGYIYIYVYNMHTPICYLRF